MATDKGIDYGLEKMNIDPETGIRHGVISQHSVMPEALDDLSYDYGKPHCPKCGEEVSADDMGQYDFFCLKCYYGIRAEDAYSDQPLGFHYDQDGYFLADCLNNDILVLRSNFYTYDQVCSLLLPRAGNLHTPVADGVKTYCLGHEWFEGRIAPYPVYRVSDNVQIEVAKGEIVTSAKGSKWVWENRELLLTEAEICVLERIL